VPAGILRMEETPQQRGSGGGVGHGSSLLLRSGCRLPRS
jgi:hypothetical protein